MFDHRLAEILQQGHTAGEFVIQDAVLTATTVAGMMTWVSFWYSPSGKRSETEIIAHTISMIDIVVQRAARSLSPVPPENVSDGGPDDEPPTTRTY